MTFKQYAPVENTYLVTWDGRNEVGHPVAAGLYFIVRETPSGRDVLKVILVK